MVPAHHNSKSKSRRRRANQALKPENIGVCSSCQAPRLPHKACIQCGAYNAAMKPKKAKAEKPKKAAPVVQEEKPEEAVVEAEEKTEVPAEMPTEDVAETTETPADETKPEEKTEDSN